MKILVSNIGSTSFKYRLFDMRGGDETVLASGGADRIGSAGGNLTTQLPGSEKTSRPAAFADHGEAILAVLEQLQGDGVLDSSDALDAVAFKTVMGGECDALCCVDEDLLERMEYFYPVAPAHNPPYVAAMRMFRDVLGSTPLVAAFEPGFHQTIPSRRRYYAVPMEWAERYGVRKYGFHGASHRYVATRTTELMGSQGRVISCHLGGSSSLCAIRDGRSIATSMGLSPQSGLPQSNRAGDFDPFAFALLADQAGMDAPAVLEALGSSSGLAALSGTSGDMRDIKAAADDADERAQLTLELFVTSVRDYLGAYLVELGGADAIVFTGGIGQNNPWLRASVCEGLEFAGILLDAATNETADGEARFDADASRTALWVLPTNEELIVARQTREFLNNA
jgi:acetate kinase